MKKINFCGYSMIVVFRELFLSLIFTILVSYLLKILNFYENYLFILFNLLFIHFFFKAYLFPYRAGSAAVAITTTDLVSKSVAIESLVLLVPTC